MSFRKAKFNMLMSEMENKNIDLVVITDASTVTYFTGFSYAEGSVLVVHKDGLFELYVPVLDYFRAKDSVKDISVKAYARYPLPEVEIKDYVRKGLTDAIVDIIKSERVRSIGLDYSRSRYEFVRRIMEKFKDELKLVDIGNVVSKLRAIKCSEEVEAISKAIKIAEESFSKIISNLRDGVSELKVAGMLDYEMKKHGAEDYSFPTIVAFNENSVYPHARAGTRILGKGSVVLIDWGAKFNGYCSDTTRTLSYRGSSNEFKKIIEAVCEAVDSSIDFIKPGIKGSEVDAIARNTLRKYGLSKFFIHGLGHGVGIDVHEYPRLSPGSSDVLEPGMVVTIEPGVYIKDKFGVRVEEMVLITEKGCRVLTSLERSMSV